MEIGEETANPSATVAILCPYLFFSVAFEGVLKRLPHAEIVPDFTAVPPGKQYPEEEKVRFHESLSARGLPWRDIERTRLAPSEFFSKYGTLVMPYYGGWAEHVATRQHRKARIFYSSSKDLWVFSLNNIFFDRIFTPGPYFTDVLTKLYGAHGVEALSTGEPKLDSLAGMSAGQARAELGLKGERPVALIVLTWGALSAFDRLKGALVPLCEKFDVVFKMHHMAQVYEPDLFKAFTGTRIQIIGQNIPITTALAAADVVVSDGSGAIFDALLADKPIVVSDTIGESESSFFAETPFYGIWQDRLTGVATSRSSIEQEVKRNLKIGPVLPLYRESVPNSVVEEALREAIEHTERYAEARKEVLERFTAIDGRAAERVAEGIEALSRISYDDVGKRRESLLAKLVRDFDERCREYHRSKGNEELAIVQARLEVFERIRHLPLSQRLTAIAHEFLS
ncbi:MAG: hypothetical protein EPO65_13955 [Dehalococcoidia bacterium]|nr:MAG: hypothetical protein EPO65_13955 [Dehalococcoidia bacterium]